MQLMRPSRAHSALVSSHARYHGVCEEGNRTSNALRTDERGVPSVCAAAQYRRSARQKRPRLFRDHHYRPRQCKQRPGYHHYGRVCVSSAHGSRGRGCRGSRGLDQHTARKQYAAAHSALCQACDASRPSGPPLVISATVTASHRVCSGVIYRRAGKQRQPGAS